MYQRVQIESSLSPLIEIQTSFGMDISLSDNKNGTQIRPISVHGMLWLQTHFESMHWDTISNGLVIIPTKDAKMLNEDATNAGINVNFVNCVSQLDLI